VLVVCETTSELETRNLDHLVICRCRKYWQLARQEGDFAVYFPLDVMMVHSLKPAIVMNGSNLFGAEVAWGETIRLGNQEFITNRSDNLSLSPRGRTQALYSWVWLTAGRHHCMSFLKSSPVRTT
jgi:hypothetical protein